MKIREFKKWGRSLKLYSGHKIHYSNHYKLFKLTTDSVSKFILTEKNNFKLFKKDH